MMVPPKLAGYMKPPVAHASLVAVLLTAAGCLYLPRGVPDAMVDGGPLLEAYTWQEDFESGSTSGWESYPPFQDTAYDFTIYPGYYRAPEELRGNIFSGGEFYAPSGIRPPRHEEGSTYYLVRGYKPDGMQGQRLGMWVKTPALWSSDSLTVSFDYWAEDRLGGSAIEVHLAGGDGVRYVHRFDSVRRNWTDVSLSRSAFRDPVSGNIMPGGVSIDAMAVLMDMEETDPSAYAYLMVDNVRMDARRLVRPDYASPDVSRYRHWEHGLVESVYGPGDALEVDLGLPATASNVTMDLSFGSEEEPRHSVALEGSGGSWRIPGGYDFGPDSPFGPWRATVRAEMADGSVVEDPLRIWRLDNPPAERPRLLFGPEDIAELRERASEGRGKELFDSVRTSAERARASLPPEDGNIGVYLDDYLLRDIASYFALLRGPAYNILYNALVYVIDEDEEAGEYAREGLLRMSGWDTWVHPNFVRMGRSTYYPVGITAANLALTFDLVYPLLSPQDRQAAREGMQRNAIEGGWSEYFLNNRVANHTSNWIAGTTAGPLLGILAMYDSPADFPAEFHGLAEKWFAHMDATYLPEGSYGEGIGYQVLSVYKGTRALASLVNAFGATEIASTVPIMRSHLFATYITIGDHTNLEMGDNYNDLSRSLHNVAWLAHHSEDPVPNYWFSLNPGKHYWEYLWPLNRDNIVHPSEYLNPSRIFPGRGSAVLRTNWEEDGVALHFRAGPHFNHTHADQGHFNMWAHGEMVALEGQISMYYDDPYFWSYNVHAGAHNVLIVDGNIQSQELGDFVDEVPAFGNHARMLASAIDESAGLVHSDLTPVYARHLRKYERSAAFTPAGNFIVWDAIESHGDEHQFDLFYHPPVQGRTIIGDGQAVYTGEKARLTVDALYPSNAVLSEREVPTGLRELRAHPEPPARRSHVVRIGTPGPAASADFLTAYLPSSIDAAGAPEASLIEVAGGKGVHIDEGDHEVVAIHAPGGVSHEGVETDGSMVMIVMREGTVERVWALQATRISIAGGEAHRSDAPEDVVLAAGPGRAWQSVGQ